MPMSVTGDGELMIPCGIRWEGQEARGFSLAPEGPAWDEHGMVAIDRMGEGVWGPERDQAGAAFVTLALEADAPARADGSITGGAGLVTGIDAAFARDLDDDGRAALSAALSARYGVAPRVIGISDAKARVPALARRRRDRALVRAGVVLLAPFMLLAACVWYPYALARAGAGRLARGRRGAGGTP